MNEVRVTIPKSSHHNHESITIIRGENLGVDITTNGDLIIVNTSLLDQKRMIRAFARGCWLQVETKEIEEE